MLNRYQQKEKFDYMADTFFQENERRCNLDNSVVLYCCSGLIFVVWLLLLAGIWETASPRMISVLLFIILAGTVALARLCRVNDGRAPWIKVVLMVGLVIGTMICGMTTSSISFVVLLIPVAFSTGYLSPRFTIATSLISGIGMVATTFIKTFFSPVLFHNVDVRYICLPEGTEVTFHGHLLYSTLINTSYDKTEYLQTEIRYELIPTLILLMLAVVVCCLIAFRGKKSIIQQYQIAEKRAALEVALNETKMQVMTSQIQPHFIFNVINSIYELCDEDPKAAQQALEHFSAYLRTNVDILNTSGNTPFAKELDHIKNYIQLEQIRFGPRLKIEYDIQVIDFDIPPLSLQPLVENAVKHGICKKREGGTILLKTVESENGIQIRIADNGTGFDVDQVLSESDNHVGLKNSIGRLKESVQAVTKVYSKVGEGTSIVIVIPKPARYSGEKEGGAKHEDSDC